MSAPGYTAPGLGASHGSLSANWRALRFFNAYRLTLATLLMAVQVFANDSPLTLPRSDPFMLITAAYALAAFVMLTLDELRLGGYEVRLQLGLISDILALGLLGFAQDAGHDNIHVLLVANIAYASLLLGGREALAFAALASIWLFILAFWQARDEGRVDVLFTHAGVIGMALFAVAILARTLARRLEASQRLAEQRGLDLANETQLNRLILERTEEGVLIVDEHDRIRHANRAALRLLHGPVPARSEQSAKTTLGDANSSKPLEAVHAQLATALRAWRQHPEEALASFALTEPERLQVRITPLADAAHGPVALFLEDNARLMEQLQQAKLAALGRLTASIAHEIRNPLSAIGHAGQLLEESLTDAQDRQLLRIIRKQVARIDRIVENVLLTSRRKLPHPEWVALKPWLEDFLKQYRQLHVHEAAHIELDAAEGIEVRTDPGHLEQIITILLDNALIHGQTPAGERFVRIEVYRHTPRHLPVLDVIDRGPGIAPEIQAHLFEPFFTTSGQGHGLGLFVARELAEANQISLQYHPAAHGGSCFRLRFPA